MRLWFPDTTRPMRESGTLLEVYGHHDGVDARFVEWDGFTLYLVGTEGGTLGLNIRGPRTSIAAYPVIGEATDGSQHNLYLDGPAYPEGCTNLHMAEVIPSRGANLCGEPHNRRHSVTYRYADGKLVIGTGVEIERIRVYERLQVGGPPVTELKNYNPDIVYGDAELVASLGFVDPDEVRQLMFDSGAGFKLTVARN